MVKIESTKCIKCELCVESCTPKVINPKEGTVDNSNCMMCSHCIAVCPKDAVYQNSESGEYLLPHNISPESFENLVHSRRSIRNYTDREIDKDTLNRFLELMVYSPTGTNSQESYITVIRGREKVSDFSLRLLAYFQKLIKWIFNPITYPLLLLTLGKKKTQKFFKYKGYLTTLKEGEDILAYNAPLVVIFHSSKEASTPEMDSNIQASYASLHAVTLDLGACFNGFISKGLNANKKMKRELNIPKTHKIYNSLLVGYPKLNYRKGVIRKVNHVNIIE